MLIWRLYRDLGARSRSRAETFCRSRFEAFSQRSPRRTIGVEGRRSMGLDWGCRVSRLGLFYGNSQHEMRRSKNYFCESFSPSRSPARRCFLFYFKK
ncbi:hypothetical protein [Oxynema aestuarii]|uniref:hypothetical protein n=1 Tax=Oxynema aestuarii TaxID=2874213 RepID=UPI001B30CC52|nr:hypothetical protein [Oxynema aestuarii]